MLVAVLLWAIGSIDLTSQYSTGTHDDFDWRNERAAVWDDFRRPDQPGLGTTATGQTWEMPLGTWAIGARRAMADGPALALVPATARDLRTVGGGLAFRCPDARNCWRVVPAPAYETWVVVKIVNGRSTSLGGIGTQPTGPGVSVAVHLRGDRIVIAINGVVSTTIRDPDLRGTRGVGLAQVYGSGSARWPSFEAER